MTIHEFIEKHGLSMTAEPRNNNPNMDSNTEMDHWLCGLRRPGMTAPKDAFWVPFSQGIGHRRWKVNPSRVLDWTDHDRKRFGYKPGGPVSHLFLSQRTLWAEQVAAALIEPAPPRLADVLDCLASDANGYDNSRNFEDWASDYGYDTDSRKAEATYRIVAEQAKGLRYFLGDNAYRELIEDVDRL